MLFHLAVLGLLFVIAARSFANGHDIRNDWSAPEALFIGLSVFAGFLAVGVAAGLWMTQ